VKKTPIRLADGRELIYYDEDDDAVRATVDARHLRRDPVRSEIRHDPLLDEWVVVAAHRQDRTYLPPASDCPLDPSTPRRLTEVPADDYDVVVFENRFPSLVKGGTGPHDELGLAARRPGQGRCEVVCFTPDHGGSFATLPPRRLRTVVEVWADRTRELSALPHVEQVFVFENRGVEIGVTLHHPHGQIYAYPFLTPPMERMLAAARRHHARTGGCLACTVLAAELGGNRVVRQTACWVAYVPAAARWPFEIHVVPRRHVPDLAALTEVERDELGPLQADVLRRLDGVFGLAMPYMAGWHQAPVRRERDLAHLRLQVITTRRTREKLKFLAASESLAGVFINDIRPEDAAAALRDAAV